MHTFILKFVRDWCFIVAKAMIAVFLDSRDEIKQPFFGGIGYVCLQVIYKNACEHLLHILMLSYMVLFITMNRDTLTRKLYVPCQKYVLIYCTHTSNYRNQ